MATTSVWSSTSCTPVKGFIDVGMLASVSPAVLPHPNRLPLCSAFPAEDHTMRPRRHCALPCSPVCMSKRNGKRICTFLQSPMEGLLPEEVMCSEPKLDRRSILIAHFFQDIS